jgi:hypothetical protein
MNRATRLVARPILAPALRPAIRRHRVSPERGAPSGRATNAEGAIRYDLVRPDLTVAVFWLFGSAKWPPLAGLGCHWASLGRAVIDAVRWVAFHCAGLHGEGSSPVPLPPPACPRPCVLQANLSAIGPSSRSHFQFELWTPQSAERPIILRKARFSPNLRTPPIRDGSRNSIVSSYL